MPIAAATASERLRLGPGHVRERGGRPAARRPSRGRRSRSKDRQTPCAGPPARVATDPSPSASQDLRPCGDHSAMPATPLGCRPSVSDFTSRQPTLVPRPRAPLASSRRARSRSCSSPSSGSCSYALRPVARRRRHVADADGRPRDRRPRPSAHGAHHDPRPGRDVDRPAVARPGRLLRRARARRDARGDPPRDPARPAGARARRGARLARAAPRRARPSCRPARGARRPVGLDDPRADGRAAALRRRPLAPRRRAPGAASAEGRCSCSRCSSSGRTSTARSSSARASPCSSASSSSSAPRRLAWLPARASSSSRRSASSPRRTGRSSSPTTT